MGIAAAHPRASGTEPRSAADSAFEISAFEQGQDRAEPARWLGWRRRVLVLAALIGCLGLFWSARWLAATPQITAHWVADNQGGVVLRSSSLPLLQRYLGQRLTQLGPTGSASEAATDAVAASALLLHHSPRWQSDDVRRQQQIAQQQALAQLLTGEHVLLSFEGGQVEVPVQARGYAALGWMFWPLAGLALLLYLFALVVVLARAQPQHALYAVAALCQSVNLLLIALESASGLGVPSGLLALSPALRLALDTCTGAAIVHTWSLHPLRLPRWGWIAATAWTVALPGAMLLHLLQPPGLWWWQQALCLGLGLGAWAVISRSLQLQPNAYAVVMRRFGAVVLATLVLATVAVGVAAGLPGWVQGVTVGAATTWYLFLASLLLLTPFLERSGQVLREFALLAGISTVAASVDLLFVAVFSVGSFTSLAVALFIALAIYAAARQAILQRLLGTSVLTTERAFDHIYRAARELQTQPQRYPELLTRLLGELFEPLETFRVQRQPQQSRVLGGGAALVVPLRSPDDGAAPTAAPAAPAAPLALALRHAGRGQRLFTHEDARLADRVVEQLRRAVAYDRAVERGRVEERRRLAQDLHDDIGARLLTMMYQARNPEDEDYIRHTLQDLKTLTRGLAAADHRLSHAAAEWKSDISQRLGAARARLVWQCDYDQDLQLTVVQWSAITRVLRELVSNALFHGQATQVVVSLQFEAQTLNLQVSDNGQGRDPQSWSHGLGLGGVRKRIKLLGGQVHWRENQPRGIVCQALMPGLGLPG